MQSAGGGRLAHCRREPSPLRPLGRRSAPRPPLRPALAAPLAGVRRGGDPLPGARHRVQCGDLQRGQCGALAPPAVSRGGPPRPRPRVVPRPQGRLRLRPQLSRLGGSGRRLRATGGVVGGRPQPAGGRRGRAPPGGGGHAESLLRAARLLSPGPHLRSRAGRARQGPGGGAEREPLAPAVRRRSRGARPRPRARRLSRDGDRRHARVVRFSPQRGQDGSLDGFRADPAAGERPRCPFPVRARPPETRDLPGARRRPDEGDRGGSRKGVPRAAGGA